MSIVKREVIENSRCGEKLVRLKHSTGLEIMIWKMESYSTFHALFGTKYGSVNTKFKLPDDKEFLTVPNGIAHYLEHKLFENEDCPVFEQYAKTGASGNAYTTFDKTCYLFSCTDNFYESLEILLSFVQEPYFTEENVEKERGIIAQEIKMYEDNASWRVFSNMLTAMYKSHPVKIDIPGTVESINTIDADLLYKCYNTFYNLDNMVLSIAGNVDEDKIVGICDRLLKPNDPVSPISAFDEEPYEVNEKEIRQKLEVAVPIFYIGFKMKPLDGYECLKAELETDLVLALISYEGSDFYRKYYDEGLINSTFSFDVFTGDGYFCPLFGGESREPHRVYDVITAEIERCKTEGLDKTSFEALKKSFYGSAIRELNDVESAATLMLNSQMDGVSPFDEIEIIAEMTFEDVQKRLCSIDTNNAVLSIIEPKAEEERSDEL